MATKYRNGDKTINCFKNPDFETAYKKSRIGVPQPNEGLSASSAYLKPLKLSYYYSFVNIFSEILRKIFLALLTLL
jgi:hypothetical protein